jgi:branched-subunit amino acid transport protein
MENIDLTQTLPSNLSTMLSFAGIVIMSAMIVLAVVIFKRWKARVIPLVTGIVAYIMFVFLGTNLLASVIAMIPSADNLFRSNPSVYKALYYIIAALAFTLARILTINMFAGKYERRGDVYIAGLGLGLGDCILYGYTLLVNITWCAAINAQGMESLFSQMSDDQIQSAYQSVSALFTAPSMLWVLVAISCVMDMVLNVALISLVSGAVKGYLSKWFYVISAVINMASLLAFEMYDATSETSIAMSFLMKAVIVVLAVYYVWKVAD